MSALLFFVRPNITHAAASCPSDVVDDGTINSSTEWDALAAAPDGVFNCAGRDITIPSGVNLKLRARVTNDGNDANDYGIKIIANSITIQNGGTIESNNLGYDKGNGPGSGGVCDINKPACGGAGFGGIGGTGKTTNTESLGGSSYIFSLFSEQDSPLIGSGAGKGTGDSQENGAGGIGGGSIRLELNNIVINGTISANGQNGVSTDFERGGGSGGLILIKTTSISGTGKIQANGGRGTGTSSIYAGGGAGGRVLVKYFDGDISGLLDDSTVDAGLSGNGQKDAEKGTLGFWKETTSELTVTNSWEWSESAPQQAFDAITVSKAEARIKGAATIVANNSFTVDNSTILLEGGSEGERTIRSGSHITLANNAKIQTDGIHVRFVLEGDVISIDASSNILVDDAGSEAGAGKGTGLSGVNAGSGGGYGGAGGSSTENAGGGVYGNLDPKKEVFDMGSGGGSTNFTGGTAGGGLVRIDAQDVVTIDGTVSASGGNAENSAGAGSGGSVYVIAAIVRGSGTIRANGGNAINNGGAGGGGRVALCYDKNESTLDFVNDIIAHGGTGNSIQRNGSDGTVFFCAANRFEDIRSLINWAWIGAYITGGGSTGFISTSCLNKGQSCSNINYGLTANFTTGDIDGWSWIGTGEGSGGGQNNKPIGWVNFDPNPYPGPPNHGVKLDPATGRISGWAKFDVKDSEKADVGEDWGWIKFGDDAADDTWGHWAHMDVNTGDISGWAWAGGKYEENIEKSGFGLLSLNCSNKGTCGSVNYKVKVILQGSNKGSVEGWGWFGGLGGTAVGFVSFSCNDWSFSGVNCSAGTDPSVRVNLDGDGYFRGWAWNGTSDGLAPGWIDFSPDAFPSEPNVSARFDPETNKVFGWARIETVYREGLALGYDDWGWIKLGSETQDPNALYGLTIDKDKQLLDGYAWSGGGQTQTGFSKDVGFGLVHFNAQPINVLSYVQTKYGDVYSGGSITGNQSTPPSGQYSATYLIRANGDITNFTTENKNANGINLADPNSGFIDVPDAENVYSNVLGTIKLDDLKAANGAKNIYGNTVRYLGANINGSLNLNNEVWLRQGDLTVSSDITFQNGKNFGEDASGLIIVEGDLIIDANMAYADPASISHIMNLASVGWIVEGNVVVHGQVSQIVGAYITMGEKFHVEESSTQLTVKGMLMAKEFFFGRQFTGGGAPQPAEIIVYDGRLLANTPTGLRDFSQAMPDLRKVTK